MTTVVVTLKSLEDDLFIVSSPTKKKGSPSSQPASDPDLVLIEHKESQKSAIKMRFVVNS